MSLSCWILSHYSVISSLVNIINDVSFNPTNNCSLVVFVVSNAIIASAAAWNLSIVENIAGDGVSYPPPVHCVVNLRPPSLCSSDQYISNSPWGIRIDCHFYCVNSLQLRRSVFWHDFGVIAFSSTYGRRISLSVESGSSFHGLLCFSLWNSVCFCVKNPKWYLISIVISRWCSSHYCPEQWPSVQCKWLRYVHYSTLEYLTFCL